LLMSWLDRTYCRVRQQIRTHTRKTRPYGVLGGLTATAIHIGQLVRTV
jgi:hypothetical protein